MSAFEKRYHLWESFYLIVILRTSILSKFNDEGHVFFGESMIFQILIKLYSDVISSRRNISRNKSISDKSRNYTLRKIIHDILDRETRFGENETWERDELLK